MKILKDIDRLQISITLAKMAHKDQVDKVGERYFLHLERVASRCKSTPAKIVAYLHDIIEDGHISRQELWNLRLLTPEEMDAICLVSKGVKMAGNYTDGLFGPDNEGGIMNRIIRNPLAREVKIADLVDNSNVGRFLRNGKILDELDKERFKKYDRQLTYLLGGL